MGQRFRGCFDLRHDRLVLMEKTKGERVDHDAAVLEGLDDAKLESALGAETAAELRENVEMARGLCHELDLESYREGNLTPTFFGSALNNFGVRELLDGLVEFAPPPRPLKATTEEGSRDVAPNESKVAGFVFKVQANMDPKHRDRIAFFRLCSGHFRRGMKLVHTRTKKTISIHNPVLFMAQDRAVADEAWPGDIIGIPNYGGLAIGDTLTEGEDIRFTGIPSFAPELLRSVRSEDPMRAKHLGRALQQLAEEGAARVFKPNIGSGWIVGVVGALQFDVLAERIREEYSIPVVFEATSLMTARWIDAPNQQTLRKFVDGNAGATATDHTGATVFLARNNWHLERTQKDYPDLSFAKTHESVH